MERESLRKGLWSVCYICQDIIAVAIFFQYYALEKLIVARNVNKKGYKEDYRPDEQIKNIPFYCVLRERDERIYQHHLELMIVTSTLNLRHRSAFGKTSVSLLQPSFLF